jgi:hypothetical protein
MTGMLSVDEDLALRRPGETLRVRAEAARQAAPVRTALGLLMRVHTPARAWRLGAAGEIRVGAQLDKLARHDPRWLALHSVPVGSRGSDIDHVVIGPGGVFTINTKHHPDARIWVAGDTVKVNGLRHAYIRNSRHEAERASRLLSTACGFDVPVTPLIVVVNAAQVTIKEPPHDVHVLTRGRLRRWLQRRPEVSAAAGEAIFEKARRSSTWSE